MRVYAAENDVVVNGEDGDEMLQLHWHDIAGVSCMHWRTSTAVPGVMVWMLPFSVAWE